MRWIILLAAASMVVGGVTNLAAQRGGVGAGAPASPFAPRIYAADLGAGLRWQLTMMEEWTDTDSIWLNSRIENQSERRFQFELLPDAARPVLTLTPEGKPAIERPLVDQPGLQRLQVNRQPAPQESLHDFRADLRTIFGKLEPGVYQCQVRFPETSFRIRGLPAFKPGRWESPPVTFVVRPSPLDSFKKGNAYTLIVRDQPPDPLAVTPRTGTVTNSLSFAITFPLEETAEKGQPLRAVLGVSRYHPKRGWIPVPQADRVADPAKSATHQLKPGESVKIVLPDWRADGDGIYSFSWPGTADDGTPAALSCLPFVIDHLTHPPAREKP